MVELRIHNLKTFQVTEYTELPNEQKAREIIKTQFPESKVRFQRSGYITKTANINVNSDIVALAIIKQKF